jgi:hypothetical protein
VTPLRFAQSVATLLGGRGLPQPVHAQLGNIEVPCEGTYVTVLTSTYQDLGGNCGLIQMADLVIIAARDCSFTANEDGTTNWEQQDAVSAALDRDTNTILAWAEGARAEAVLRTSTPSASFQNTGGLALVTVLAQLPVP